MCEKYKGWNNRETWLVKLWIDNEQVLQEDAVGRARGAWHHAENQRAYEGQTRMDSAKGMLADYFEDYVSSGMLKGIGNSDVRRVLAGASLYSDILGGALARVDWYEIAEAYLSDLDDE